MLTSPGCICWPCSSGANEDVGFYRESLNVKRTLGAYDDPSEPCGFLEAGKLCRRVPDHNWSRLRADYAERFLQCPRGPGRPFVMEPKEGTDESSCSFADHPPYSMDAYETCDHTWKP
jgi:hypothetical protein